MTELRTAAEWDADPRNGLHILSWSDPDHRRCPGLPPHGVDHAGRGWSPWRAW